MVGVRFSTHLLPTQDENIPPGRGPRAVSRQRYDVRESELSEESEVTRIEGQNDGPSYSE